MYEVRQEANQEAHSARLASIAATNWGNTAQQALDNNEEMLQRLRTAYEDDTWDLLTGGMVSPRSVSDGCQAEGGDAVDAARGGLRAVARVGCR